MSNQFQGSSVTNKKVPWMQQIGLISYAVLVCRMEKKYDNSQAINWVSAVLEKTLHPLPLCYFHSLFFFPCT